MANYGSAKRIETILKPYEFEVEYLQKWHLRCLYFGEAIFDFYPKRHKLFDLKGQKWHELSRVWGGEWENQLTTMLDKWVHTNKIEFSV